MGNSQSVEKEQIKEHFFKVCNVFPDIPMNNCLIWTNQDLNDTLPPPYLDLRYSLDVAPFVSYKNVGHFTVGIFCSYIYNVLQTKFNITYLPSAFYLYELTIAETYKRKIEATLTDTILQIPETVGFYYYNISKVLHILQRFNIPEERMTLEQATERLYNEQFYEMQFFYIPKDEQIMKMVLFQNHLILANLTIFNNIFDNKTGLLLLPHNKKDECVGMITIIIVGYKVLPDGQFVWMARMPFNNKWGEHGYGYIPVEYFDKFNRDRWIIEINSIKTPLLSNNTSTSIQEMFALQSSSIDSVIPEQSLQQTSSTTTSSTTQQQQKHKSRMMI